MKKSDDDAMPRCYEARKKSRWTVDIQTLMTSYDDEEVTDGTRLDTHSSVGDSLFHLRLFFGIKQVQSIKTFRWKARIDASLCYPHSAKTELIPR